MKIYTQEQFDALPRNEYGIKECHSGNYTNVKAFAEWCSFGKGCSFGEGCSFGKWCKAISPFWSFMYEPPFDIEGKIYPTAQTRNYWEERLKLDLSGCYQEIEERVKGLLPEILKRDDLTKCERKVIQSWIE